MTCTSFLGVRLHDLGRLIEVGERLGWHLVILLHGALPQFCVEYFPTAA